MKCQRKFHSEMKRTDRSVDNIQPLEIHLGNRVAEVLVLTED